MAKIMLNGIDYSAPTAGAVTGIKGDKETEYRAGYVNLTPENIGALSTSGGIIDGNLTISQGGLIACTSQSGALQKLQLFGQPVHIESDTTLDALEIRGNVKMVDDYGSYLTTIKFDSNGTEINRSKLKTTTIDVQTLKNSNNPGITINTNILSINGDVRPYVDNEKNLGNSSYRWKQLYAGTSVISTSDRSLKTGIEDLDDKWVEFFMLLQPKSYLFKDGESGRTHVGFISQDVEEALEACGLTSFDFAGFCKDQKTERITEIEEIVHPANEETGEEEWVEEKEVEKEQPVFDDDGNSVYIYSLRYEEFIALNTMMIQELCKKSQRTEDRIAKIEEKLKRKDDTYGSYQN